MRYITRRSALLALTVSLMAFPASSSANSTSKQIKAAKASGTAYLESIQQNDGGFPGFDNDWDLGALAAAGVAAADVSRPGGEDARSFYSSLFGDPATWPAEPEASVTEFERAALNAYAAGIDPARVSVAQNLIARIIARYQPAAPGYYGGASNFSGALFGLLALADAKTRSGHQRVPQALLAQSIAVLRANQHTDGGWTFERAEGNPAKLASPAEPDETGAAIAALCSAGVPNSDPAIAQAAHYLESILIASTGAFDAPFGPNTDSNAWGVQGLDACGLNPQGSAFTTTQGRTPIDFLLSQQLAGGAFVFEAGEAEGNEYSSQDALRAISGAGFTAKPPATKGGPRWVFSDQFQAGQESRLALVIDDGTSPLKACAVTVSPTGASTTLAAVLEAAQAGSSPASCVTGFQPASGKSAITQIDGAPSTPGSGWEVSIDDGKEKTAKLSSKVSLGDTISLRLR